MRKESKATSEKNGRHANCLGPRMLFVFRVVVFVFVAI